MPTLNIEEALRYAGVRGIAPEEIRKEMERAAETVTAIPPRSVWRAFPLRKEESGIVLEQSGVTLTGELAAKMLSECDRAVLLAITLGERFRLRVSAVRENETEVV